MMRIVEGNNIETNAWNELVNSSSVATWFQTKQAYEFYSSLSFLEVFAFAVETEGQLKAVVVGYIQKDGGRLMQFFSRRAIILGGPLLSNDISDEVLEFLLTVLKTKLKKKAIYIETRNFNNYGQWKPLFMKCGFEYEPHLNYQVDCTSTEIVWDNLKENRKRQIRRAIKEDVVIEEASSENDVLAFYDLLRNLYKKKVKTPLFPEDFFLLFYRRQCGKFLLIKTNGNVIGGIMCPILGTRCIYEWFVCGKDVEFKHKYPSVMATWAAIDYANNHNIDRFDFMGAGKPDDGGYGVRDFKSKFGGKLVEDGRFIYICKPFLYRIGRIGVKILKGK